MREVVDLVISPMPPRARPTSGELEGRSLLFGEVECEGALRSGQRLRRTIEKEDEKNLRQPVILGSSTGSRRENS